jgi:formate/nitrite transporter FocA (FNT family)
VLTRDEQQELQIQKRTSPPSKVVHDAILNEGREELKRPTSALFWSALAAGLSMGLSLAAEGLLAAHLPETPWQPLVTKFGYTIGFLIVVLGRQQLFTENTLTAVLPLMIERSASTFLNMLRLWGVVLAGNLAGSLLFAWFAMTTNAFDEPVRREFVRIGHDAMAYTFGDVLVRGIVAGWIIALMVWLLPFAEAARFFVIVTLTYVVGIAKLSHIIAGSTETFALAIVGEKFWWEVLAGYTLPTLIGNMVGGVALVAALNHAQVVAGTRGNDE